MERLVRLGRVGFDPGPRLESLTPRKMKVLRLLAEGLDGFAISEKLFLSPATVRNHVQHIRPSWRCTAGWRRSLWRCVGRG